MTNSHILSDLCLQLTQVNKEIHSLKCMPQTPKIMEKVMVLSELRDNIKMSIIDLRGAIACGADNPNPLAGWC